MWFADWKSYFSTTPPQISCLQPILVKLGVVLEMSQVTAIAAAQEEEDNRKVHTPDLYGTAPK